MELDPKTDLTFTRILPVPRDLVWECWTKPEHIKQFFVPKPHLVTWCEIDLRVGGRFNTVFEVDGKEMRNTGVYLDIITGRRLVFSDAFMEGWKPASEPFMTVMVDMSDAPDGGTSYTVTARHRTEDARAIHEEMGFYRGWGAVTDQLVEFAKSL